MKQVIYPYKTKVELLFSPDSKKAELYNRLRIKRNISRGFNIEYKSEKPEKY